ncbi:MAG: hypothetical protein NTW05_16530 [Pseudonocardiales bacterium]|nr:hypothetical protein [Pseudonocardiales bacterium]
MIEHTIPAAVLTPAGDGPVLGLMVLVGTYVGVVPVALGMLVLPLLHRVGPAVVRGLLALTVGLLTFLAVDAALDGVELATAAGGAFSGVLLVILGAGLAFLALTALDRGLDARRRAIGRRATGLRLATMIATGIGLHNLGEGLAIGSAYAVGELALGAALVVGFALHHTTEGLAIITPVGPSPPRLPILVGLGLLAGAPAILGGLIGVSVDNQRIGAPVRRRCRRYRPGRGADRPGTPG